MPKTEPKPADKPEEKWDGKKAPMYVRVDLSAEQKAQLAAWAEELEHLELLNWITDRVERGHVLSVRANEVGFQCSLTGASDGSGHLGLCMVGRASTPIRAIQAVMFRDKEILRGIWPKSSLVSDLDF